ncbi:phage tail tape measure protein [Rhodobacter maris]|uniref:Lambda family phage tail tape measure protein n=1 Tax=Rhodobacter maris TaxID=446682 RepID=A0A285SIM5_9RHOB|nr:phage tail tape measure protein [Rhodobacter maris]SOC07696.1 lambda family phage tail tape measure protein [Rhodobacter maris]
MVDVDGLDGLSRQALELERSLGGAEAVAGSFSEELGRMRESLTYTGREVSSLSSSFGRSLRRAFDGVVFDGVKLSDALETLGESLSRTAYSVAMRPVQEAVGGALASGLNGLLGGVFGFAKGGAFNAGQVLPFAKGGVVSGATPFALRGATGLMGEAGPEAILPLARGADGRLGVSAQAGRAITVVMQVSTPDVAGFARSSGQIAQQINRALARGARNA